MNSPRQDSYTQAPEYQLAQRVLKAWEASPVDDNGFGETVALARAYMAMVEERTSGPNGEEQRLELASALERELVRKVLAEVEPITEGWQPMFHAGAGMACEEILYRLEILWGERKDDGSPMTGQPIASPSATHGGPK